MPRSRYVNKKLEIFFVLFLITAIIGQDCVSNPCMYGVCIDESNRFADKNQIRSFYSCYCIDGYTGINCEINWDDCWSNPCLNGGTCNDGIALYNCSCTDGFVGLNCEQKYSECMNHPCLNNGTCNDRNGSVTCQCPEGYSGEYCETDVSVCNDTICKNNGSCVEGPGFSFACECAEGWWGQFCEEDVNECLDAPCQNGGLCINIPSTYTCACLFGFTGKNCDKAIVQCETNPCKNEAICLFEELEFVCYCVPDYHGAFCELRYNDCEANSVVCQNDGICLDGVNDFTCSCLPEFHGRFCEVATSTLHPDTTSPSTTMTSPVSDSLKSTPEAESTTFESPETTSYLNWTLTEDKSSTEVSTESYLMTVPGDVSTEVSHFTDFTTFSTTLKMSRETLVDDITTPFAWTTSSDENVGNWTIKVTTSVSSEESTMGFSTDAGTTKISSTETEYSVTEQSGVYKCDEEECSDTTLCLNNFTQCDCSYSSNCKKVFRAAFNGKAYIRQEIVLDDGNLDIFVRLRTKIKDGVIIHALFDDQRFALLYLEVGQLKFQFSCGFQTMLFGEIDSPINNGLDVDLEVSFQYIVEQKTDKCTAKLLVNDSVVMSGEQILQIHESVPRHARLHLGGIPITSQHFPQTALGFIGCMSLLQVNNVRKHFIEDSVETFQISECHSFMCLSNPCQNAGACQEVHGKIQCSCNSGHWGEFCEKSACDNNPCHLGATCIAVPGAVYLCVCPLGMHGLFCEEEFAIKKPSFSVPSPGFSSYVAYGIDDSVKSHMELKIRFIPHIMEQISLLAYMGQSASRKDLSDYFSVTFVRGYIMFTWDLGSGVRRIFTNSPLVIGPYKTQTVIVARRGREAWLYVEGVGNVTGRSTGSMMDLDVSSILYIGGHKSKYFENLPHDLPLHSGFVGCIFDVVIRTGNNVFPVSESSPATGRGVGECHHNECSSNACKNGAVCMNHGPTYSCICMKDWEGPDCSTRNCVPFDSMCHKTVDTN